MVKNFKKNAAKVIALIVSVLIVLTILPISALVAMAFGDPDNFFVKVVDEDTGLPINGANVILVPEEGTDIDEISPTITDANGISEFNKISEYFEAGKPSFGLKYTVTADGYKDVAIEEYLEISSTASKIDVSMVLNDTTEPVISGITGNPTEWTKENAEIGVEANDVGGRGCSEVKIDGFDWKTYGEKFSISENGSYTAYVKDKDGNISASYNFEVSYIDKTAPVITSITIDPNTWTKDSVIMRVNANDSGIGIAEYGYKIDADDWQKEPEFPVSDSLEHTFYVRDKFGFVSNLKQTADKHDNVKPEITSVTCEEGWSNTSIKYTVAASDNKSGVAKYGYVLSSEKDDENKISWNASGEDESVFTITDTNLYSFFVKDNAGNISNSYDMATPANIETTKPIINSVTLSTNEWTNQNITFTVDATDEGGSGVMAYRVDGREWKDINTENSNKFVFSDNAEHTFEVKDNAGNVSAPFKKTASNYENVKPVISEVVLSETNWTNQSITFTVDATDEGGSGIMAYRVAGSEWKDINTENSNKFVFSDNAEHTFEVKDNAGNISDPFVKNAEKYDAKKPELDSVMFNVTNSDILSSLLNYLSFGVFFNKDETITISASDNADATSSASGIASYTVYFKDTENNLVKQITQEGNEFLFDYDEIKNFKGSVYVKITDNAGNYTEEIQVTTDNSTGNNVSLFMIENDKPVINAKLNGESYEKDTYTKIFNNSFDLTFVVDDNQAGKEISGVNYVEVKVKPVTAGKEAEEIKVYEKDYSGSKTEMTEELSVAISFDFNENTVEINGTQKEISEVFDADGKIELSIYAVDNSGNVADLKIIEAYLDKTSPEIKGFDFSLSESEHTEPNTIDAEKEESGLYKAVDVDDYGFYFKQDVYVTVTAEDKKGVNEFASGVKSIKVAAVDYENNKYTVKEIEGKKVLAQIDKWDEDEIEEHNTDSEITFTVFANFKGQIFAFATDNVGNDPTNSKFDVAEAINGADIDSRPILDGLKGYVYPNGSVLETLNKHKTTSSIVIDAPETAFTQNNVLADFDGSEIEGLEPDGDVQQSGAVGIDNVPLYSKMSPGYNGTNGFDFDITVIDSYSGIRSVKYAFIKNGEDASFVETKINNAGVFEDNVNNGWEINEKTKDRNLVTEIKNTITAPDSIENNDITLLVILTDRAGNTSYDFYTFGIDETNPYINIDYNPETGDESYQRKDANEKDYYNAECTVTVTIKDRNFRKENVKLTTGGTVGTFPISEAELQNRLENGKDGDVYTATIVFSKDGDYKFNIECTDNADNSNNKNSKFFTIDNINPVVKIDYDNNDAKNINYYKADRKATITVIEHNFDSNRFEIVESSASETQFPALSGWNHNGDVHTATINFTADSKYMFKTACIDKSGRVGNVKTEEFTVDKTNPVFEISGIVDKSANSGEGNIGFIIRATDTNFDVFEPVITAVRYIEGKFETSKINPGAMGDIANGRQYSVANINTDGIYRITCTVVDKAGNAFSEVIIQDANGRSHTEKRSGDDVLLTFSVNRNGSVFYVEGYTEKLLKDFYVQNITENVQINEINADTIVEKTITVNGKAIVEGDDYTVTLDKGEGTWHRYTYSIKKSVFEKEGEYNIVIFTKDRANNQAYSDIKNVTAKFVVDRTAPTVTIAGLKSDGRYRTDKQVVTVIPSDAGGSLKKLIIRTVDQDGNVIKELINLEGEALLEAVAAGNITFELGEGLYQNVEIICEDAAGNVTGENASGELYENVSVSTNAFLIFWANKLARYLAIAGVVVVFGGVGTFAVLKKKKVF